MKGISANVSFFLIFDCMKMYKGISCWPEVREKKEVLFYLEKMVLGVFLTSDSLLLNDINILLYTSQMALRQKQQFWVEILFSL